MCRHVPPGAMCCIRSWAGYTQIQNRTRRQRKIPQGVSQFPCWSGCPGGLCGGGAALSGMRGRESERRRARWRCCCRAFEISGVEATYLRHLSGFHIEDIAAWRYSMAGRDFLYLVLDLVCLVAVFFFLFFLLQLQQFSKRTRQFERGFAAELFPSSEAE